jgi:hypothetical protein
MTESSQTSLDQLKRALGAGVIDQATFDAAAAGINVQLNGSGAIAHGHDALAVGAQGMAIEGNNFGNLNTGTQLTAAPGAQVVYAEKGATVVIGDAPVTMTAVDRQTTLGRYLQHLISQNRFSPARPGAMRATGCPSA